MDIRGMTLDQDRVGSLHKLTEALKDQGLFRNCLNCLEWSEPTEKAPYLNHGCTKFKAMPPPRVIVVGCEHHTDMIPF